MAADFIVNLSALAAMLLLLGTALVRGRRAHTESQGVQGRRHLSRVILVAGILSVAGTVLVLVNARNRPRPFDVSTQRTQLESLEARARVDSVRTTQRIQRDQANAIVLDGVNLATRGYLTAAIERYDQAAKIDPTFAVPLEYKGYALFRLDKQSEALAAMQDGLRLDDANPWAHYNLALVLWASGDTAAGIDAAQAALTRDCNLAATMRDDVQFRPFLKSARFRELIAKPCEPGGTPQ